MSLDTVLEIGKALRSSEESLSHFKYVKSCPEDNDKESVLRLNIPVRSDISFNWDKVSIIPENRNEKLFYLTFKTSDSDGLVKYIFGDIYYELKSRVKRNGEIETGEGGYYRVVDENAYGVYKKSSFHRGEDDFATLKQIKSLSNDEEFLIEKFRSSFSDDELTIEKILKNIPAIEYFFSENVNGTLLNFLNNEESLIKGTTESVLQNTSERNLNQIFGEEFIYEKINEEDFSKVKDLRSGKIFLHFDFNGKHWYEFRSELDLITNQMLDDFFEDKQQRKVLKKTLYKTLCSGDKKNDKQFPGFRNKSKFKSKFFSDEEAKDLFYAKEYSEYGLFTIKGTEIKVIILPRGNNLSADDFKTFFKTANEKAITARNQQSNLTEDPIFTPVSIEDEYKITSFDFVFSKRGGISSPDTDLIELSGIEKSSLKFTMHTIKKISKKIKEKYGYEQFPRVEESFLKILGTAQVNNSGKVIFKTNSKYQSHILKVLPKIYSQSYYQDLALLPAVIEKVEFSIRAGNSKYNTLKFHLEFLFSIQNHQNNKHMEITNSKSYQLGLLLGSLSKDLKNKINSFEKNYVGNLTRRISTLQDCIKFKNEIEEKNIMHDLSKYKHNISTDLSEMIRNIDEPEYDKEQVAFGFFENYFKYESKQGFLDKLEKLISDYAANEKEKDAKLIEKIGSVLKNYQTQ